MMALVCCLLILHASYLTHVVWAFALQMFLDGIMLCMSSDVQFFDEAASSLVKYQNEAKGYIIEHSYDVSSKHSYLAVSRVRLLSSKACS
jgi:hypothetical protein